MQKKTYTSKEVQIAEEEYAIKAYLARNTYLKLIEYPIESVKQRMLNPRDSIPDAIVQNIHTGEKFWLEITTASRSSSDREKMGLMNKGLLKYSGKVGPVRKVDFFADSLIQDIANAIYKKSQKRYEGFANLTGLNLKGNLIIFLRLPDPFHDLMEHSKVLTTFKINQNIDALGLAYSSFDNIFLLANIVGVREFLSLLIDKNAIQDSREWLEYRKQELDKYEQNI